MPGISTGHHFKFNRQGITMNETKLPGAWKWVPVEPTPQMLNALHVSPDCIGSAIVKHSVDKLPDSYAAMLAAAPQPGWPGWPSATAPGPDGMQHCIAVPGMPSAHDDISAQLREYASNPGYSHNDYADTMRQAADAIDAGLDAIRAWSTPAPVQQAAPSEPDAYMAVLSGGEPVSVNFQKIHADWKLKEWEDAGEVVPLYRAAPAQPAGLSEQDKLDAARYRFVKTMDKRALLFWRGAYAYSDKAIDDALAAKAAP